MANVSMKFGDKRSRFTFFLFALSTDNNFYDSVIISPQGLSVARMVRALTYLEDVMADSNSPRRFTRIDRLPPYVFKLPLS